MEANTTGIGAIVAVLHWLLPTLIGSALAVWYRRKDVVWSDKRKTIIFKIKTRRDNKNV